ncbi:hypothetical protein QTG56_01870 [Rossellomorea sp. AcN35-11]|nr:hypothetical protein [Rossellomorea aquimaris]NMH68122.1 hypothetical protein [Bacillus sp. RO3]WJV29938.1 hypothetical protein QTG56_01870 [Rossellomorea sp. AcN35-11]
MSPYLIQDISAVEIEKEKRRKYQGKYEVKITMDLMVIHFSCHTIHVS